MMKLSKLCIIAAYIFLITCEDSSIAYPGNYKNTSPSTPKDGQAAWYSEYKNESGGGRINEETIVPDGGIEIAILSVDDNNPDDDHTYTITGTEISGERVEDNYFSVSEKDDASYLNLVKSGIDYETLISTYGESDIKITIGVKDDSPDELEGIFSVNFEILNINEDPQITNWPRNNSAKADEYCEYIFDKITWTDVDIGDEVNLSWQNLPSWLNIDENTGIISGTPTRENVSDQNSFSLIVTDESEETDIKPITIDVRRNSVPSFTNFSSLPAYADVEIFYNFNFDAQSNGFDIDWSSDACDEHTITAEDLPSWMELSTSGLLTGKPPVSDIGRTFSDIKITVTDNRDVHPESLTSTFEITVRDNDAPVFTNLGLITTNCDVQIPYNDDINWEDPNSQVTGDDVTFNVIQKPNWLVWSTDGYISGTPQEEDLDADNILVFEIFDDRPEVPDTTTGNITFNVRPNDPPVFTNTDDIPVLAIVDSLYSYDINWNDPNLVDSHEFILSGPNWLVGNNQGIISGTPDSSHVDIENNFTATVTDTRGLSAEISFTIDVSLQ